MTTQPCVVVKRGVAATAGPQDRCGAGCQLGQHACHRCAEQLRRYVRELEQYAVLIPQLVAPVRGAGGRAAPGYRSRPPARLDVIVATDWRSRPEPVGPDDVDDPILHLHTELVWLAGWMAEQLGRDTAGTGSWVVYLLGAIEHARSYPWVDQVGAWLRYLHHQARLLARDQPPPPIGPCLTVGCPGQVWPCWAGRQAGERVAGGRCGQCGRTYDWMGTIRVRLA